MCVKDVGLFVFICQHRRLDAVYYYMHSLATVPSFQSAYDSLVAIFAKTGQKVGVTEGTC